jgi:hypothetical protein
MLDFASHKAAHIEHQQSLTYLGRILSQADVFDPAVLVNELLGMPPVVADNSRHGQWSLLSA